jgi:4a-hydroxytetrahydrobiopterin dehydratase
MRTFDFPAFTLDASHPQNLPETPMTANDLATQHCQPLKGKEHALDAAKVSTLLDQLPGWKLGDDKQSIIKDFKFDDFHHTLGFINAVGFMANHEDHHPDIAAGYGHCQRVEQLLAR